MFSWLTTVTVPGWILVGLYMAFYFAGWAWFCGVLRPGLRKLRDKPSTGLDAVTQQAGGETRARNRRPLAETRPRPTRRCAIRLG